VLGIRRSSYLTDNKPGERSKVIKRLQDASRQTPKAGPNVKRGDHWLEEIRQIYERRVYPGNREGGEGCFEAMQHESNGCVDKGVLKHRTSYIGVFNEGNSARETPNSSKRTNHTLEHV
jgi:hypothetical protein